MITPFTEDNRIDYDAVLRIIEWYDKNGVDGIFAVCQSSEMFELSPQERVELAKFIINNTPKHMGVIASGHCAEKVEDQIREAQTVNRCWCRCICFHFQSVCKRERERRCS